MKDPSVAVSIGVLTQVLGMGELHPTVTFTRLTGSSYRFHVDHEQGDLVNCSHCLFAGGKNYVNWRHTDTDVEAGTH